MKETAYIIFCTAPDEQEARMIARQVVEKKLAACCTIVPKSTSVYYWENQVKESSETLLIIKSTSRKFQQLEKEIKMMHSYTVPEIIANRIEDGSLAYMEWLFDYVK